MTTIPTEIPPTPDVPIITQLTRVLGSIQAGLGVLTGSAVLLDLHPAIPTVLALAVVIVGAVQAGLRTYAQGQVTASADVVEFRDGGDILAGPANDQVGAGEYVRTIGVG